MGWCRFPDERVGPPRRSAAGRSITAAPHETRRNLEITRAIGKNFFSKLHKTACQLVSYARRVAWTCPDCRRSFGRKNQSHECAPSGTVDEYFAARPPALRKVYDALERRIVKLGASIDPVTACIMFKRARTFAEIRAKRDRLTLAFILSRELTDDRIDKRLRVSAHRVVHYVELRAARDVDRELAEWLAEAYACSPE